MKSYKPYLSLSKTTKNYELGVVLSASKNQTVTSIEQEEVVKNEQAYWGVILTLSTQTQLVNGPDTPIFSSLVHIPLEKGEAYKTIKCIVRQKMEDDEMGPPPDEYTDIDFGDGK
ncbi:hypothetical protein [Sunxiuqinia dokdonensis]|uniref:Uncharacterized protein n=1 Tax=Sunxiuqinia dokdonensis TaxID=1409788 RepID=A0A0L8VBQ2_9BACT|nr:hypothetical protein [Sunxiuqinia dokdonensis]KOH45773.1 hypothetical protein NC99_14050 [Sunxiuqinia dokdonensis]